MASLISKSVLQSERRIAVVVPSVLRHDIAPFLNKLNAQLGEQRLLPQWVVVTPPQASSSKIRELSGRLPTKSLITEFDGPMGQSVMAGFSLAAPFCESLLFVPDDYGHMLASDSLAKLAGKIGAPHKLVLGAWDNETAATMPYPTYLNERGVSVAVTFARAEHPTYLTPTPTEKGLEFFISEAKKANTWVQVYSGVMGVEARAWPELEAQMAAQHIYAPHANPSEAIYKCGFEAAPPLYLAAHEVLNVELPRRFEHSITLSQPDERKFAFSRLGQFRQGLRTVLEFCARYSQNKVAALEQFGEGMAIEIASAPFVWPTHAERPISTEWNQSDVVSKN